MQVSIDTIIPALSITVSLAEMSVEKVVRENLNGVTIQDIELDNSTYHSRRASYIALQLGKALNLNENSYKDLYMCSLLHDIGYGNVLYKNYSADEIISKHCIEGADIVKHIPKICYLSDAILYHHEHWDGNGVFQVKGDSIPIISQILRISDIIDSEYSTLLPYFKQKDKIKELILENVNKIFSQKIYEAFLKVSHTDEFWLNLANNRYLELVLKDLIPSIDIKLDIHELISIGEIFADMIDAKSTFTATHSRGIAELAYLVSKYLGYDDEKCLKMKIAGLFHDIGKLAIPSYILDKNGPLDGDEFSMIKSHVYFTRLILSSMNGIEEICDWASNHHEKLNGNGYPRGVVDNWLSEECRVMAVCDIYQALTEDRPYRKGMNKGMAFSILDSMVEDGSVCATAVNNLKNAIGQ
ncbi:HD-GYP domain-containing protein [Clostridium manihotivorum]|uniref:Hydrolase n=1 Tax=Clostridium manihotivorum TaxID=2320868 RepID=A0A3R5TED6_9CLOT|nr:HD domain-containing phosphohydrolase [Clostridium manihotivorum]QAA31463.1 hydrolase [Clostridium manihotivorum]